MVNNLIRAFLYAAVALTVDVLWGYTGILTFGQSAFFGIGVYAAGLIFTHLGFSAEYAALAFGAGVIGAVVVAFLVGWLAFYHGASPLYASVVTLVLPIVVTQILYSGGTFTGSSSGLSGFESFQIELNTWFWISGVFLVVVTAGTWLFVQSDAGRVLVAIRENEPRCEYLGLNVSRVKTLLLAASAVIASIAGYAFASVQMVVAPEYAGFVFGTELVIWVALGGRGTLIGPVIGTLLIDVSTAYLSGNMPFMWKLVIGVTFVLVILVAPEGIGPLIMRLLRGGRREGRRAEAPRAASRRGRRRPTAGATGTGAALEVSGVRKRFGSLLVLDGIDFTARRGELLSLVGPNGAGKTTLLRCIADGGERSAGDIAVNGRSIERRPPYECVRLGVGRKFQNANIFDALTVAETIRIAHARVDRPSLWSRSATLDLPQAGAAGHAGHRARSAARSARATSLARAEAGAGAGDGAVARAERAPARRADRRPHQAGAHPDRTDPGGPRPEPRPLHRARRARPRLRPRDQLAGHRAAPGPHRPGRHGGGGGGLGDRAHDLLGGATVTAAALELQGVSSGYGEAVVVREVALDIRPGEIFVLLGKNGMGKSTLLKTVMGFLPIRSGTIRVSGEDITGQPPHRIARRAIAYTPQEQALFQDLSVEENLQLAVRNESRLRAGLRRMGEIFPFIPERLKQRAGTLSGGEQKMLLMARALMSAPRLVLVDEITEGLQPSVVQKLAAVLKAERERAGTAMLLIEQHVTFALEVADRYAVLKLGEIVDRGSVEDGGVEQRITAHLSV